MAAETTVGPPQPRAAESGTQAPRAKDAAKEPQKLPENYKLVEEFFRHLLVAEKHFALYPLHGKVVQESLDSFLACTEAALDKTGPLRLVISQKDIRFEDAPVYEEESRGKSVAFRLHKDGIRELAFLPGVDREDLEAFLICLKEARKLEDEDDDFITLFWEKDCDDIRVHMADDFVAAEDLPELPARGGETLGFDEERFSVPAEEKERLAEILASRRSAEDEGDSTFEISDEERATIRKLVDNEEAYFPIFDFLDILLELMVRRPDAESFDKSVKMIRSVIDSMIDESDFEHAAVLLEKFASDAHPSLNAARRSELRDMASSFNDKKTLNIIREYLEEHPKLPSSDHIFRFMRAFPKAAAEDFCAFLVIGEHLKSVSEVLVLLGTGKAELFTRLLGDPDPLIVRAMIGILMKTDEQNAVSRIARALKHPDESVRLHAANTMLEHGDADAGPFFIPLLDESSRQLLNIALQFLAKVTVVEAFERLRLLTSSRRFRVLDLKRQEIAFKALLKASPTQGVEHIRKSVLRWGVCLSEHSRMRKSAALNALAYCGSEEGLAILVRFGSRKRGPLVPVASRAMKNWEQIHRGAPGEGAPPTTRPQAASLSESQREVTRV